MDAAAPITGGCLCGRVRFAITEPLLEAEYCHCKRCQRRSGTAASASAMVAPGSFGITEGEEWLGAFEPDGGWSDYFCSGCGSHLYGQSPDDPQKVSISLGVIDGDPGILPSFRQFVAYAAPWEPIPDDGLPRFDERRV